MLPPAQRFSLRKKKIKTIKKITLYPLGLHKSKRQTTTIVDKDTEKLEHLRTADGNIKCCCHFGKQFGSSSNVKHRVIILSNNSASRYLPRNDNTCPIIT